MSAWHSSLPIQVPWTARINGTDADIMCPGNTYPWRMAAISGPDREQTAAYAHLITAAPALYDALADMLWLCKRNDENYNDVFERIGERFYNECGMLRPGKSQADALNGTPSDEERERTFEAWRAAFYTRARAALSLARGEQSSNPGETG